MLNNNRNNKEYFEEYLKRYPQKRLPTHININVWSKNCHNLKFGDIVLYQIISYKDNLPIMSYPKLCIFSMYNVYDIALVYEFLEPVRSWEYNMYGSDTSSSI